MRIVVIGASAGGLSALVDLTSGLPATLCACVLVVVHTRAEATSVLPEILSRSSVVPVSFATDGARLEAGRIFVAPPDQHLTVGRGIMRLSHGPKENGFRPAVDPLFRSAARCYGGDVMGVILSGALDDGTYGLKVVKDSGGIAVVQNPEEATHPGMPLSALRFVDVDHVADATDIAKLIVKWCGVYEGEGVMAGRRDKDTEPQSLAGETDVEEMEHDFGPPSGLTCPDCGGALWEIHNGELARYRCHVGHQYTTEGLDAEQSDAVEGALWSAVRVLEEHADLRKRMADRAERSGMMAVATGFADSAVESQRQAHTIRELLFGRSVPMPSPDSQVPTPKRKAKKAKTRRRAR